MHVSDFNRLLDYCFLAICASLHQIQSSIYRNGLYQKIIKCNTRKVHKHNFKPSFSRDKIKWNPYFKRHAINHIVKIRTMVVLMSVSTYVMCVGVYRLIEFLPQITIFNKSRFVSMFSAYFSGHK